MAKTYYTVLTTYGAQLFAQAMANRQQVRITQFAVGDGNGRAVQPDSARTSLVRQVHRANISAISNDPRNNRQVIFELTIPENVGGFWIREMGIYDNNNRLVAYANCPDTYKPQLSEGSGKIQVVRMILLVSSSNAVTLSIDNSVIFVTRGQLTPKNITATSQNGVDETGHTHAIDHATTGQKGIVQLTNDTGLDSETLALTAKAGKALSQRIAQNQQGVANLNSGKVDKTAISHSVSSTSKTTVGSSFAVKTAYDKGVEAKNAADAAQRTANAKWTAQNATTTQKGIIQLADDLTTNDNTKALTAKQGKILNDKLNVFKVPVKGGAVAVNLDLTNRAQIIEQIGDVYKGNGRYYLTFHNSQSQHRLTNFPLGDTRGSVELIVSIMGGFSFLECYYIPLNRRFVTAVNWNNPTLNLNWQELALKSTTLAGYGITDAVQKTGDTMTGDLTARNLKATSGITSGYRVLVERNDPTYAPYINIFNKAVDLNNLSGIKDFAYLNFIARRGESEKTKTRIVGRINPDKSSQLYFMASGADDVLKQNMVLFGKSGNVAIGKERDDGERLQVEGDISATKLNIKTNAWEKVRATHADGSYWRWETHPDGGSTDNSSRFNFVLTTARHETKYVSFPNVAGDSETVAYQRWVNNALNGKVNKAGDTMTGKLIIEGHQDEGHSAAGVYLVNRGRGTGTAVHFDGGFHKNRTNKGGMHVVDSGDGSAVLDFFVTPNGDANQDRRHKGFHVNPYGGLWSAAYGWLHDYFMKREDFIRTWYPNHYAGTEVYKIRHLGLMITVMNTTAGNRELLLPEGYSGHAIVLATDRGGGHINVSSNQFLGSNRIRIGGRNDTHCSVLVIGKKDV